MNKKGAEKLLSMWWFFILALIGVSVVGAVILFYGSNLDARQIESEILARKLMDCVVKNGEVDVSVFNNIDETYDLCNLKKEVFTASGMFYFKISMYNNDLLIKSIESGLKSYSEDCAISSNIRADKYPKCTNLNENAIYYDLSSEEVEIRILAASNQFGRRIPLLTNENK